MENKYSRTKSLLLLSTVELFERISYYGMRAILVLYLLDAKGGFYLDQNSVLDLYNAFTLSLILLPIPLGLLTDLVLKQTRAVLWGSMIALVGYCLLISSHLYIIGLGLLIISIGTSLVKPNVTVLIGRLFDKSDGKRDLGFLVFFGAINLGAFISVIAVGYVGEMYGWKYGFGITAFSTFIYLIIFYFIKDSLNLVESNLINSSTKIDDESSGINVEKRVVSNIGSAWVILLLGLVSIIFWNFYHEISAFLADVLSSKIDLNFLGMELPKSTIQSLNAFFSIPITLIFFVIWYFKGTGSALSKIGYSIIFLAISMSLILGAIFIPSAYLLPFAVVPMITLGIAEILISPIIMSFVTRLSDVRYSSTIFSLYILVIYLGAKAFELLAFEFDSQQLMICSVSLLCLGIGFLLFKKKILGLINGLD